MAIEEIFKPAQGAVKKRKRRGRGNASGLGGESGRGHKGQKSRSGYKSRPGFEGGQTPLYRRIPKKPGMKNIFKVDYVPINLSTLGLFFKEGDSVNPETLLEKGIIKSNEVYKILGDGELDYKLSIVTYKISKSALKKLSKLEIKVDLINN
jgi:large subunit ribosomal protein L15